MAESIPEEIVVDILLRLPAKSLGRFKCVCKRWRSLISNPGFVRSHLQRLKARDSIPSQRIIVGGNPLKTVDYEALDGCGKGRLVVPHWIKIFWVPRIVGSCDGLVCLIDRSSFHIYNPTTREYIELPGSDVVDQNKLFYGFRSELFYGFGYDSQSNDYKIVEGVSLGGVDWDVAILSLKSGSWRRIQVQFEEESHLEVFGMGGVYWNGALRWCASYGNLRQRGMIMSFDLSEEKFHWELPFPEVDGKIDFVGLGIHGASLFIYSSSQDPRIEAWIMDEHGRGGSWTKWFSIDCIPAFVNCNTPLGKKPLAYTRSGKIVLKMYWNQMILFNPEDNTWKEYPIHIDYLNGYAIYLETLLSPYLGGQPSRN
ncbi:hypothetical protein ACJRO7_031709 [Eucalyptus globulus]|uniref:F-box domain-containing protein n=1 Tax=Eucalyptus globulus TaxID=34317 RepID=A0ABD3JRB2_EUCGL